MTSQEGARRFSPDQRENGNLRVADPAELIRDNPAALIINQESYARMEAYFSPAQFDPPQVVRVITFSSQHGQVIKEMVLDGLTRTMFVDANKNKIAREHPEFQFRIRDVTDSVLRNRAIVPEEERVPGRNALTMLQYLRAVVPPTIEHSQIAADRIAAHLINAWENMVGSELSTKFSALAAFGLLANPQVPLATDRLLQQYLKAQALLVESETTEQRERLEYALGQMASIIRQAKLIREEVAKAAFVLVSAQSPVIGGRQRARKEIYGLLHTPEIDGKIKGAAKDAALQERYRDALGTLLSQSFERVNTTPNRDSVLYELQKIIKDPSLNYQHVVEILSDRDPQGRHRRVISQVNRDRLFHAYSNVEKRKDLSDIEVALIDRLGRQAMLDQRDLGSLHRAISQAHVITQRTAAYRGNLQAQRKAYTGRGVSSGLLDEATRKIAELEGDILKADSWQSLQKRTKELELLAADYERRIARQVRIHTIGGIVDNVYQEALGKEFGSQIRQAIIEYIIKNQNVLGSEPVIRRRLEQLRSLDPNLQSRVLDGGMSIEYALQQRERIRQATSQPSRPAAPRQADTLFSPSTTGQLQGEKGKVPTSDESKMREEEKKRKDEERERLRDATRQLRDFLYGTILEHVDLTAEDKQELDLLFIKLGQLRFNNPDIVAAIEQELPKLRTERIKAVQDRLHHYQEQAAKDTRTGR